MRPRDEGTIIQVGSALAYRGIPLQSAYCGSKHAIQGFTDSLRTELLHDDSDVRVARVPETMNDGKDSPGRLLAVDGETILLSVLGGEELPGVRKETAIWSSDTGFATVLLELLGSHLGEPVEGKL